MKRKRLTLKQNRFIKEYITNGGNGTQAALKIYDTTDYMTANDIASENLQKPLIQQTIDELAKSIGINDSTILERFNSVSDAQVEKVSADAKLKATIELAKILNLYPDKKSYQFNMSVKGNIKDLGYSEAKKQLEELNNSLTSLQEDDPT